MTFEELIAESGKTLEEMDDAEIKHLLDGLTAEQLEAAENAIKHQQVKARKKAQTPAQAKRANEAMALIYGTTPNKEN